MSLMNCPIHGEVGFHPYVSRALGCELDAQSSLRLADIHKIRVDIYDDNELLLSNDYYLLKDEIPSDIHHLTIRTEQDEKELLKPIMPKFKGGGYCVQCFHNFLSKIMT